MALLEPPKLLDETFDKDGKGSQTWEVMSTKTGDTIDENPLSVQYAVYPATGERLPGYLSPNPYLQGSGRETIVTNVAIRRSGKIDNQFKATITYGTPNDVQREDEKEQKDTFQYPWDEPAEYSQEGTTLMEFIYTQDFRGQPFKYSNGENISNLGIPTPITIINITRKRLASSSPSSPSRSESFYRTVNSGAVTIRGVTYAARTVLVEAFPIQLEKYIKIDTQTGNRTTIDYYVETVQLAVKKNTWATRVRDEGTYVLIDGETTKYRGKYNDDKSKRSATPFALNGKGEALGAEAGETISIQAGTTPSGVTIDSTLSDQYGVTLAFMMFDEVSFAGLNLGSV